MHQGSLSDYVIKVLLDVYVVDYSVTIDVWNKLCACSLMIGLLSMCKIMGLHMYIAPVDLDWGCE